MAVACWSSSFMGSPFVSLGVVRTTNVAKVVSRPFRAIRPKPQPAIARPAIAAVLDALQPQPSTPPSGEQGANVDPSVG